MLDHVGIQCADMEANSEFYDAALAPLAPLGVTRQMDFGAFVRDPDGNNVEAVCHLPVEEG